MGTVYHKTVTRPLPADAETFVRAGQRFARWKRNGRVRTAPLTTGRDGSDRILETAATYTAKYRDGAGLVVEIATGCRDADAARRVLADLERRAELVKSGVIMAAENAVADHQATPLAGDAGHVAGYLDHLRAKEASKTHRDNVRRQLNLTA